MESKAEISLEAIISDLKIMNSKIIDRFEAIESILNKNEVTDEDVKFIKEIDNKKYTYDEFFQISFDINPEIILNIVEAIFSEASNRGSIFFDKKNNREYEKLNEYKRKFIHFNKDVSFFLSFLDNLESQLTELESIFSYCSEDVGCFNFKHILYAADKEPDLTKKKQIYVDALATYSMYWIENEYIFTNSNSEHEQALQHFEDYKLGCQKAIEIIDYQLLHSSISMEIPKADISLIDNNNKKDFTTKRQVLAIYYLLEEFESTRMADRSAKARFIEFMTGKNYDSIYGALSEPHKGIDNKNNKNVLKDMEFVKGHFEKLRLNTIAQKISGDMNI